MGESAFSQPTPSPTPTTTETRALQRSKAPAGVYRRMIQQGCDKDLASNLTAEAFGLPMKTYDGKDIQWKLKEVESMLFLLWRIRSGRAK